MFKRHSQYIRVQKRMTAESTEETRAGQCPGREERHDKTCSRQTGAREADHNLKDRNWKEVQSLTEKQQLSVTDPGPRRQTGKDTGVESRRGMMESVYWCTEIKHVYVARPNIQWQEELCCGETAWRKTQLRGFWVGFRDADLGWFLAVNLVDLGTLRKVSG